VGVGWHAEAPVAAQALAGEVGVDGGSSVVVAVVDGGGVTGSTSRGCPVGCASAVGNPTCSQLTWRASRMLREQLARIEERLERTTEP
jgi:hypothetical protein